MIQLKEALNDQGVKVEAIEVSVDTRGFESSLWQGQENPGQEAYEQQRRTPRRINLASLDASFEEEATEEEGACRKDDGSKRKYRRLYRIGKSERREYGSKCSS